jgi:hypothetical protein
MFTDTDDYDDDDDDDSDDHDGDDDNNDSDDSDDDDTDETDDTDDLLSAGLMDIQRMALEVFSPPGFSSLKKKKKLYELTDLCPQR